MGVELILSLLGGLALFLYGMQMMSANLEVVAGTRMKQILERLTSNRILGVLVGAGITAVIQSSSATTVMVVGFVNSGLMTLQQAVWIIMGANIGTTITGQLVALDIGKIAPLIAFAGVAVVVFSKKKHVQAIGSIAAGLGILFIGLSLMSDAMMPLRESETFINLMTSFSNPVLGILAGALFTAIIQSSSASVGILQALAVSGLIGLDSAVYVLFGQNIGTCITALLASIGANRNAKRTTIIHLMFNIIGTIIFVSLTMLVPFTHWIETWVPNNPAAQIANIHTIFNVTTTLLLLPFGTYLAKLAEHILPDKRSRESGASEQWLKGLHDSKHILGTSAIAVNALLNDVRDMLSMAFQNVEDGFTSILKNDLSMQSEIKEREEKIDQYNLEISKKISEVMTLGQSMEEAQTLNHIFSIVGNAERIGDHALNIAGYAVLIQEKNLGFSDAALEELTEMKEFSQKLRNAILEPRDPEKMSERVHAMERETDLAVADYRKQQLIRLKDEICSMETAIIYSELLVDYERIGDHALNIAQEFSGIRV
ncbi:Na/Pi cotransporter family protein [Ructibacterium gallinarum]|uniref:Na/Pi cotransporter family protein n=1 Tax=Ructibacterium gallinarum TaxID=2779355 RepID=A0A9D5M2F7_9FIRM|nr:Na/Pi cotransporter family protein [Ructibacterium gallinarum]MBE5039380.1 Na/Pi cotransporter family protein [Ructibacterium gallinarum]